MITKRERLRKILKRTWQRVASPRGTKVPVYVFGEMRSGTNMLLECLDRSLATEIFNETDDDAFLNYELRDVATIRGLVETSPASHVAFKPTADGNRAREIMEALPNSRGVWTYRAFEDVVNSALVSFRQHRFYLELIARNDPRAAWRARNLTHEDVSLVRSHLERGISDESSRALIWWLRNDFYFRCGLYARPDVLLVRYENLVATPREQFRRIFDFVRLSFKDRYVSQIFASSVQRRPPPSIDPRIRSMCEALTQRLDAAMQAQPLAE